MSSAGERVREAIGAAWAADADELVARATDGDVAAAARVSARARARLGTGEGRELLEEAVSTRAVDERGHGALLEHVARIAESEVLARRGVFLLPLSSARIVVDDRERTTAELAAEARDPAAPPARRAIAALMEWSARDRDARLEGLEDATERRARVRARGPAAPDDAPTDLHALCVAFLDATDDAAADLVARAHHAASSSQVTLASRIAALAPIGLDAHFGPRGRARRVGAMFDVLGLGAELRDRVALRSARVLSVAPGVVRSHGATLLAPEIEAGVASESAYVGAVASALAHVLVSRALPLEHALAPRASVARAMGVLFSALFADGAFLARYVDDTTVRARTRIAATAALALGARHACATIVAGRATARTDDAAREIAARALVLDPSLVTPELARSSWISPVDAETQARALLGGLSWPHALRERYDEDFFRNPRLADFVRGAAARGGTVSVEAISLELGATPAVAAARIVELAEKVGH